MAPLCRGFGISHGRGDRIHDRDHDFGLPSAIRTDNGAPSASPDALFGLSKLSTGRLRLGITIPPIRPGNPQQNGRLERIHLTLEKQATKPASCDCLQWPERFDEWMTVDDTGRPNQPPWARPFPSTVASPDRQGPRRETGSEERAIDQEPRRQALDRDVRGRLDRVRGCHGGAGCSIRASDLLSSLPPARRWEPLRGPPSQPPTAIAPPADRSWRLGGDCVGNDARERRLVQRGLFVGTALGCGGGRPDSCVRTPGSVRPWRDPVARAAASREVRLARR